MNQTSKVSILVPVYNVEKYLNRCLNSILNQSYINFELILVDDCSNDNSLAICYEYAKKDKRIKVIEKKSHTVLSDVRNVGIDNASGKYLMFIDSDDYVEIDFVEKMVKAIEENNVDVVRCKAKVYNRKNKYEIETFYGYENKIFRNEKMTELLINFTSFENNISCYTWALIIRKEKLNIRFNTNIYCRQDAVFLIDLLLNSVDSIFFLDEPLYNYCFNETSITNNPEMYLKYVNDLFVSSDEIKQIIKSKKLLTENLENKINIAVIDIVFYRLKRLKKLSYSELKNNLRKAYNVNKVNDILESIKYTNLNFKRKIRFFLMKNHLYFFIILYIKIIN